MKDGGRIRRETNEEAGRRGMKKPEEGLGLGRRREEGGRTRGKRMRKWGGRGRKPEEGGRIWKKRDEGGMFLESVGTRRTHYKRYMLRLAVISRWPATW